MIGLLRFDENITKCIEIINALKKLSRLLHNILRHPKSFQRKSCFALRITFPSIQKHYFITDLFSK